MAGKLQLYETLLLRDFRCHTLLRRRRKMSMRRRDRRSHYQEWAPTHEDTKNTEKDFGFFTSDAIFFPFKGQACHFPIFCEF